MKRLLKIFLLLLTLLLALLLLYGCAQNSAEQSESVPESESQPESSAPESSESSSAESKPDDEYLGTIFYIDSYIDIYKKAVETNETRPILIHNEDGVPNSIGEAPATEYWIVDKDGNNFIDHPFYDFSFFPIIKDASVGVIGCYKGDYYRYEFIDGHFKRTAFEESGVFGKTVYNNHPGYVPTRYCYETFERAYGISDKDGNVIFEPVFCRPMPIPFSDRFLGITNNLTWEDFGEGFTCMFDEDKNIICTYSTITFHHFDDGSYVSIAWYAGYSENYGCLLRDKDGNVLKEGHRFIDKYGNELSPCFDLFEITHAGESDFVENYFDVPIKTVDSSGSTIEIKASDYICKP